MLRSALVLFAALAFVASLWTPTRADENKEPWKAEDIIYAESAQQMGISPNAQSLVWVKSTGDKEKDARVSNLFLSALTLYKQNSGGSTIPFCPPSLCRTKRWP